MSEKTSEEEWGKNDGNQVNEEDGAFLRELLDQDDDQKKKKKKKKKKKEEKEEEEEEEEMMPCDRCGVVHSTKFKAEFWAKTRDSMVFKDTCVKFALESFYSSFDKDPVKKTKIIMQHLMKNNMALDILLTNLEKKYDGVRVLDIKKSKRKNKEGLGSFASMGIDMISGTQMFRAEDDDDECEDKEDNDKSTKKKKEKVKNYDEYCIDEKDNGKTTTTSTTGSSRKKARNRGENQSAKTILTTQNNTSIRTKIIPQKQKQEQPQVVTAIPIETKEESQETNLEDKMLEMFGDRVLQLLGLDNEDPSVNREKIMKIRKATSRAELEQFVRDVNNAFPSLVMVLPQDDDDDDEMEDVEATPIMDRETQLSENYNNQPTQLFDSIKEPNEKDSDTQNLLLDME